MGNLSDNAKEKAIMSPTNWKRLRSSFAVLSVGLTTGVGYGTYDVPPVRPLISFSAGVPVSLIQIGEELPSSQL